MPHTLGRILMILLAATAPTLFMAESARAQGEWEITAAGEDAVERGLAWLAANQGSAGNWGSDDLGVVSMGALAFLSAGHTPYAGRYRDHVRRAVDYVVASAKPSGLLNISTEQRDMYNHGLSAFVLTQAYGLTQDRRVGEVLDKALRLIADVQCDDGGWDYKAVKQRSGHDLSLAVMQAKALRGAMDVGLDIPPRTIDMAIRSVRAHYRPSGGPDGKGPMYGPDPLAQRPGRFTYNGQNGSLAMATAGAVCLQEFAQYDDFRIYRSMDSAIDEMRRALADPSKLKHGSIPFNAYTTYYLGQALYQVGGARWRENYPPLREALIKTQRRAPGNSSIDGSWEAGAWLNGRPSQLYGTSVSVFVLTIPNRYLPILQEGNFDPAKMPGNTGRPAAAPAAPTTPTPPGARAKPGPSGPDAAPADLPPEPPTGA